MRSKNSMKAFWKPLPLKKQSGLSELGRLAGRGGGHSDDYCRWPQVGRPRGRSDQPWRACADRARRTSPNFTARRNRFQPRPERRFGSRRVRLRPRRIESPAKNCRHRIQGRISVGDRQSCARSTREYEGQPSRWSDWHSRHRFWSDHAPGRLRRSRTLLRQFENHRKENRSRLPA